MIAVDAPPSRRRIRRLDPSTVARIAAGEVVERPASVVKELVENAIDAGATRIEIRIEEGGLGLIEVADDGQGIPEDELGLAVERYATNKLLGEDPADGVGTLGFRGEALAAIAAVSRFRLVSRTPGSELAYGLSLVAGAVAGRFEIGRAPGTTVEVRELFFATPARRKFLKAPAAEQVAIVEAVDALYLAHPEVGVSLATEERELLRYPPSARLRDAAGRVLGTEFLLASFAVRTELPGGGHVEGLLGRPTQHRPNGSGLWIAINGRTIRSRAIVAAVRLAYQDHLPRTRFPIGVLHLELPTDRVDVNVHPTKAEVRIARERELLDTLRRAVREALQAGPAGAEAPRARPLAPGMAGPLPGPSSRGMPVSLAAGPAMHDGEGAQTTLDVGSAFVAVAASDRRPGLRLVGSLFDLYWIADTGQELWVVDQHAASERLLYDRLRAAGRLARQELVLPRTVPLTARQIAVLADRAEEIAAAGFEVDPFGPGVVRVRAVPAYRGHTADADALPALLEELAAGGRATVPDGGTERIAASLACHAAVRGGDAIAPEAMRAILGELDALDDPAYACPHGRPIALRWSRARLDRMFLRSGA